MEDELHPRVLYVGNLDASITEDFLVHLFGQIGSCQGCKLIHETGADLYAFVEFAEHPDAQMALMAMNKRMVLGKEMKVNWASSPGTTAKQDTSNHFHVFVGDMSHEIDTAHLREAFMPFGQISDCKVIRDPQTHKSKGFGFVCFVKKEDAEIAIASMNGQWLGGRAIRTNWANGKASIGNGKSDTPQRSRFQTLDYDDVFSQASASNTTIYCGGIQSDLSDSLMRETFGTFGTVVDVRVFQDKGFAFIKMDSKEAAARGITDMHGAEVNGYNVKCSWGKEQSDQTKVQPSQPAYPGNAGGYGYNQPQMNAGYWGYNPQQQGYPQQQQMQQGYNMQQQYGAQQGYGAAPGAGGYGAYGMQAPPQPMHQQQAQWGANGSTAAAGQWSGNGGGTGWAG